MILFRFIECEFEQTLAKIFTIDNIQFKCHKHTGGAVVDVVVVAIVVIKWFRCASNEYKL